MLSGPKRTLLQRTKIAEALEIREISGKFGIEIEVEGTRLPDNIPGWIVHREGSLRGEAMEYVTAGAIQDSYVLRYMNALRRQFTANQATAAETYRAGVHVHYNMTSRTFDSTIRAIILWAIIEPLFLKLCGAQRDGNLFCVSSYDTGDMPAWLSRNYRKIDRNGGNILAHIGRGKYSALNSNCLTSLGTLECRAFPTTVDPDKIYLYCQLVDAILQERPNHPREWVEMADKYPQRLLDTIFGNNAGIFLNQNIPSLLGFGAETGYLLNMVYEENMG